MDIFTLLKTSSTGDIFKLSFGFLYSIALVFFIGISLLYFISIILENMGHGFSPFAAFLLIITLPIYGATYWIFIIFLAGITYIFSYLYDKLIKIKYSQNTFLRNFYKIFIFLTVTIIIIISLTFLFFKG